MIHVAVIGYGYWGPNLVRNFQETDGARMAVVLRHEPAASGAGAVETSLAALTTDYDEV